MGGVIPVAFEAVAAVVRERTNYTGPLTRDTALQADLGVYGDDLDAVILGWAERFGVDLSEYRPHFHTPEEGLNPGGLLFPPPASRAGQIPITLGMLHDFAERGAWGIDYPEPLPDGRRPDVWVNRVLAAGVTGGLAAWLIRAGCG